MSCSRNTNACSRTSRTPDRSGDFAGRLGLGTVVDRPGPASLAPRTDVMALDHLVWRRRLDEKKFGRALLHAAGDLERRLDQPFLDIGDDVLERDSLRRHHELRRQAFPCGSA